MLKLPAIICGFMVFIAGSLLSKWWLQVPGLAIFGFGLFSARSVAPWEGGRPDGVRADPKRSKSLQSSSSSPLKQAWANALGAVTTFCTLNFFLSYLITDLQSKTGGFGPYFFDIVRYVVIPITMPLVIICTSIALDLVGPRRSKLAWISCCLYFARFAFWYFRGF